MPSEDVEAVVRADLHMAECAAHVLDAVIVGMEADESLPFDYGVAIGAIDGLCLHHMMVTLSLLASSLRQHGGTPKTLAEWAPGVVAAYAFPGD